MSELAGKARPGPSQWKPRQTSGYETESLRRDSKEISRGNKRRKNTEGQDHASASKD